MKIIKFKPYKKNTLLGFLDAQTPEGYIFKGLTWHKKEDGEKTTEWIGLPSREYTKDDGSKAWATIIEFTEKKLYWNFVEAILEALKLGEAWDGEETPPSQDEGEVPF